MVVTVKNAFLSKVCWRSLTEDQSTSVLQGCSVISSAGFEGEGGEVLSSHLTLECFFLRLWLFLCSSVFSLRLKASGGKGNRVKGLQEP